MNYICQTLLYFIQTGIKRHVKYGNFHIFIVIKLGFCATQTALNASTSHSSWQFIEHLLILHDF